MPSEFPCKDQRFIISVKLSLIIFCLLFSASTDAQILKGRITSDTGEPIAYATVYIHELKQGTTTNAKGDYLIKIPSGLYHITYQCLGYSPLRYDISISGQETIKDVNLTLQYYQIPEVRIMATGEDPAYGIMRKAIGMAPYYLNNISHYKAEVYIKGNLVFNKIPRIIRRQMTINMSNEDGTGTITRQIREGDHFMLESFNEVEFDAPDKYVQRVISVNSTIPDQGENISPMDLIQASFYEPLIAGIAISPLSPQAFSYYRFRYLGATTEGSNTINKIEVLPRVKSQQLFEGTIYILENLWCIQSLDMTNDNIAGRISVQQLYVPVQDDIWMPVSHKFIINLGIMGVRADAEYGSSIRYLEVKPNLSLRKPSSVTTDLFTHNAVSEEKDITKNQQKIEEILQKDELNNRDMVKLSRLMNRESDNAIPDSISNNLEIKDNAIMTVDDDAYNRDSAYWAEIRPIPLSELEKQSIRIRDSIQMESTLRPKVSDSVPADKSKEKSRILTTLSRIGFGHTWSDTSGFSINYGGLIDLENFSFNTVDGFVAGVDFRLSKRWKNNTTVSISPGIKWAFSRESLMWNINGYYRFDRMRNRQIFFRAGMMSSDISTGGSVNRLINTVTSLFAERNYLKLYGTDYFSLGYRSELTNGLNLEISGGYDNRRVLDNTTDYSFVNTTEGYSENIPDNPFLDEEEYPLYALRDMRHYEIVTQITYTPKQKYRLSNGAKIPLGSDWPTFELIWKHGINEFSEYSDSYRHYDMMKLLVHREIEIGAFGSFSWRIGTGGFLNRSGLTFFDFFHFNEQPLLLVIDNYLDAFRLPSYYSMSSPEFYGEAHVKYTTPYLLLKYLPGLSRTLIRENLSLSYLGSEFHRNYTEIGYSMSEISLIGEFGIYVGFENLSYRDFGIRFVLRLR